MHKAILAIAAIGAINLSTSAMAQEGPQLDCAVLDTDVALRGAIGHVMTSPANDAAQNDTLKQLAAIVEACATRHSIDPSHLPNYFEYSLARIAREALIVDLANAHLSTALIDQALDFGTGRANPDLSENGMAEQQIMAILQAFSENGVDIDKVDPRLWEKVGAYSAATSLYWKKRNLLPY